MSLLIKNPGILTLLQDAGRFGQHSLGLTTGGPMDPLAFKWANRLVSNDVNATALEITVGGFKAEAKSDLVVAVTGAKVDVKINGQVQPQWQTLKLNAGDELDIAYATEGCRIYLAVAGGFDVSNQFGSTSTVIREGIGGLDGKAIPANEVLPVASPQDKSISFKRLNDVPSYDKHVTLRVIPGYQEHEFSRHDQRMFFYNSFEVSDLADRMGYRLKGPKVNCKIQGILSEGICLGAIQVPADGQPIILMNDRQTIGGYPKIGSVFSLDLAKLAQLTQGASVQFEPISIDQAHNLLHLAKHQFDNMQLEEVSQ